MSGWPDDWLNPTRDELMRDAYEERQQETYEQRYMEFCRSRWLDPDDVSSVLAYETEWEQSDGRER